MAVMPHPVETIVCDVCGQGWYEHAQMALTSALNAHYEEHEDDGVPFDFENHEVSVTLEQCVVLLKKANQGPEGPPGMQGPMGMTAVLNDLFGE